MRRYLNTLNIAVAIAAGTVIGVLASGTAKAITDTVFRYTAPKTGYLAIDVAGFSPMSATAAAAFTTYYVYDGAITTTAAGSCFGTSVNLPNGAKMTALAAWYSGGATVSLYRHSLSDGGSSPIVNRTFSHSGYTQGTVTITDASLQTVNTAYYSYALIVCLPATSDNFGGARVNYTYTTAGD